MKTKKGFFLTEKMIRVLILLVIFVILFAALFSGGGLLPGAKRLTDRIVDIAKTVKIGEQVPPANYTIPKNVEDAYNSLVESFQEFSKEPLARTDCIVRYDTNPFRQSFNEFNIRIEDKTEGGAVIKLLRETGTAPVVVRSADVDKLRASCILHGENLFAAKKTGSVTGSLTVTFTGLTLKGTDLLADRQYSIDGDSSRSLLYKDTFGNMCFVTAYDDFFSGCSDPENHAVDNDCGLRTGDIFVQIDNTQVFVSQC